MLSKHNGIKQEIDRRKIIGKISEYLEQSNILVIHGPKKSSQGNSKNTQNWMTLEMQYIKTGGSLDIDLKLFLKQHQKGIYSTEYLC